MLVLANNEGSTAIAGPMNDGSPNCLISENTEYGVQATINAVIIIPTMKVTRCSLRFRFPTLIALCNSQQRKKEVRTETKELIIWFYIIIRDMGLTHTFHNDKNAHVAVRDDWGWNDKTKEEHVQHIWCRVGRAYFPVYWAAANKPNKIHSSLYMYRNVTR